MPQEIERKFLIKELPDLTNRPCLHLEQGYLCLGDKEEVRLRITTPSHFQSNYLLTVKKGTGLVRGEEEISLLKEQFVGLWPLTIGRRLTKKRYLIFANPDIEVDVFEGPLEGLIVAEVEFKNEEDANSFHPPDWMGKDVTNDEYYKNRHLAVNQKIPS